MIVNLVDNALKFTPVGGIVDLSVKLAHLQPGNSSLQAVLEVRDTGCGIPAEALPHIFERFYRVDQARSHSSVGVSSGSGLGLAIVQEVVQQHHGILEVTSLELVPVLRFFYLLQKQINKYFSAKQVCKQFHKFSFFSAYFNGLLIYNPYKRRGKRKTAFACLAIF